MVYVFFILLQLRIMNGIEIVGHALTLIQTSLLLKEIIEKHKELA